MEKTNLIPHIGEGDLDVYSFHEVSELLRRLWNSVISLRNNEGVITTRIKTIETMLNQIYQSQMDMRMDMVRRLKLISQTGTTEIQKMDVQLQKVDEHLRRQKSQGERVRGDLAVLDAEVEEIKVALMTLTNTCTDLLDSTKPDINDNDQVERELSLVPLRSTIVSLNEMKQKVSELQKRVKSYRFRKLHERSSDEVSQHREIANEFYAFVHSHKTEDQLVSKTKLCQWFNQRTGGSRWSNRMTEKVFHALKAALSGSNVEMKEIKKKDGKWIKVK